MLFMRKKITFPAIGDLPPDAQTLLGFREHFLTTYKDYSDGKGGDALCRVYQVVVVLPNLRSLLLMSPVDVRAEENQFVVSRDISATKTEKPEPVHHRNVEEVLQTLKAAAQLLRPDDVRKNYLILEDAVSSKQTIILDELRDQRKQLCKAHMFPCFVRETLNCPSRMGRKILRLFYPLLLRP